MKRYTPLKRRTPLRARSLTKKYRRRARYLDHMATVRRMRCAVAVWLELDAVGPFRPQGVRVTPCSGHVQADHVGRRPFGQKCDDRETAPMCRAHHEERTDVKGFFRHWSAGEMRIFCNWAIEDTQRKIVGYST